MITLENLYLKLCSIENKLLSIERKELLEPHNEAFGILEDHIKQCPSFNGFWLEEAITESKDLRFAQTCHHIKCSCKPSSLSTSGNPDIFSVGEVSELLGPLYSFL